MAAAMRRSAHPTTASFNDPSLTNATPYFYVVTALNSAGESGNSNQASATPANAVADVTITIDPLDQIDSPYIYGTILYLENTSPQPNFTFDRDGGNRWTAYNWETNASNAGSDYLYENDAYLSAATSRRKQCAVSSLPTRAQARESGDRATPRICVGGRERPVATPFPKPVALQAGDLQKEH